MTTENETFMPDNWIEIVNKKLEEEWKHTSRVTMNENGEIIEIFPDGKVLLIVDKDGKDVNNVVGYIEPGYEKIYGYE